MEENGVWVPEKPSQKLVVRIRSSQHRASAVPGQSSAGKLWEQEAEDEHGMTSTLTTSELSEASVRVWTQVVPFASSSSSTQYPTIEH